jgi:hypothetical protein
MGMTENHPSDAIDRTVGFPDLRRFGYGPVDWSGG